MRGSSVSHIWQPGAGLFQSQTMAFGLKEYHGEHPHSIMEDSHECNTSAMALTEILRAKGINPPGITPEGAAWLAKTLHPADNNPPWTGIPVGSGLPSVMMEYESLIRINPNAAAAGTWACYLNLLPHPVQPFSGIATDSVGDTTWGLRNPTLYTAGNAMSTVTSKLMTMAGAYKMVYASATIELDAPALSNQGSATCAQYPMSEYIYNPAFLIQAGADAGKLAVANHVIVSDVDLNLINRDALAAKPYSYSGLAREGVYCVLKMDPNQGWVSTRDTVYYATMGNPTPSSGGAILPLAPGAVGTNELWPWLGGNLPAADRFIFANVNPATSTGYMGGSLICKMGQPNFARIALWNLSVTAGLTVRVRWGVEYLVPPNSVLSPSVRACAPKDDTALAVYSRIVDELPDAFPGSYNSWDDLGRVLKEIWKRVSPVLGYARAVPGIPGVVAGGIQAVGDLIANSTKNAKQTKQPASVINMPAPQASSSAKRQRKKGKLVPSRAQQLRRIAAAKLD